jgi:hypothetical protein
VAACRSSKRVLNKFEKFISQYDEGIALCCLQKSFVNSKAFDVK